MSHVKNREFLNPVVNRRDQINFHWLLLLRWAAVAGQVATIVVTYCLLKIEFSLTPLLTLVAVGALTNLAMHIITLRSRSLRGTAGQGPRESWIGMVMVLDIFLLTAMLYASGGPTNPFSVFYIVNIALSAAVLKSHWAWSLTVLAILFFSLLFVRYIPVAALEHGSGAEHAHHEHHSASDTGHSMHLHLRGMLVAFAGAAIFVTYFVTRVSAELREQDQALAEAERRKAKAEKLDSLITLAAGAAHELSTPLSTIAVIARELEFGLCHPNPSDSVLDDIRMIRAEIDRCRNILNAMSARSGESMGESWQIISLADLLNATIAPIQAVQQLAWNIEATTKSLILKLPHAAVEQSIRSIIKNSLDATQSKTEPIILSAKVQNSNLVIVVEDHGQGISPEIIERIGEPFFTTKPTGEGMGLGLFLARRVWEQLGGTLIIQSHWQQGTKVEFQLPLSSAVLA